MTYDPETIRALFAHTRREVELNIPGGRSKAVAMTKLDEAEMWSLKAISDNGPVIKPVPRPAGDIPAA